MDSDQKKDQLESMLQCSVCMYSFQATGRRIPKMLSCQHSFCVECLKNISDGRSIQCPICRKEHHFMVDELPNNLLLMQLLDLRPAQADEEEEEIEVEAVQQINVEDVVKTLQESYKDPSYTVALLLSFHELVRESGQYKQQHLELILQCMSHYRQSSGEVSAEAASQAAKCVFILLKNSGLKRLPKDFVTTVSEELMATLNHFKTGEDIKTNCVLAIYLLTIEHYSVLDQHKATMCLFDCLSPGENDRLLEKLAIISLNNLRDEWKQEEKASIASVSNVQKLMKMLVVWRQAVDHEVMHLILGLLMPLTDEEPSVCFRVISENGLSHLVGALNDGNMDDRIKQTCLILLNNLAEVPYFREHMIGYSQLVDAIENLINSEDFGVKYSAIGIAANLSMVTTGEWGEIAKKPKLHEAFLSKLKLGPKTFQPRDRLLNKMHKEVLSWGTIHREFGLAYTSFKPFYEMLAQHEAPAIQLFAAWTIHNFCTGDVISARRYKAMLVKENGTGILQELKDKKSTDSNVRRFTRLILDALA